MIYFFYGKDSYRAKQTIGLLRDKFIEMYDPSGNNIELIDQSDFTLEKFFNSVKSSGFLAEKKFIILKNLFSHKKFLENQDAIIDFLKTQKNTRDENYLVFWHEGKPRSTIKLFKYLSKICSAKCINNFEPLKTPQLKNWLRNQAAKSEKKLDPDAADLLISYIGDDTWHLYNEMQKLIHSTSKDSITKENVEKISTARGSDEIFPFLDALGEKNKVKALELFEKNQQTATDYLYLLAMMIRQFRLILKAKEISKTTKNSYAISQQLGLPVFITNKIISQSTKYSDKDLVKAYRGLVKIDETIKSDAEQIKTVITLFIHKL